MIGDRGIEKGGDEYSELVFLELCTGRGLATTIKDSAAAIGALIYRAHVPPWPNGQGVGLLIQRLWVRVPQGVTEICEIAELDVVHVYMRNATARMGWTHSSLQERCPRYCSNKRHDG